MPAATVRGCISADYIYSDGQELFVEVEGGSGGVSRALTIDELPPPQQAVDAGLMRQQFHRLCAQRKPAIGQDVVPTLQQFLNLSALKITC